MYVAVEVTGGAVLRRNLRAAAGNLDDLKALHQKVAAEVLPFALAMTPVRSGALLATGKSSGTTTTATIRFGSSRTPYAGPLHYGYPSQFRDTIARQHKQGEHPWLVDAVQNSEQFWIGTYWNGIQNIINSI